MANSSRQEQEQKRGQEPGQGQEQRAEGQKPRVSAVFADAPAGALTPVANSSGADFSVAVLAARPGTSGVHGDGSYATASYATTDLVKADIGEADLVEAGARPAGAVVRGRLSAGGPR
ncbi:hypothetical protein ACFY8S_32695 [Streptomyces hygroscopicus]|uniref:hypothetical protein n=1 Tax=Streptomyces hygroscopicus TaxID=1912 RepID=UPI00369C83AD